MAKQKKSSIRGRYTLILIAILGLLVGAQWLFNHFFLERYYLRQKLSRVGEIREMSLDYIDLQLRGGDEADMTAAELQLRQNTEASGVNLLILRDEGPMALMVFSSGDEGSGAAYRIFDLFRGKPSREMQLYEETADYRTFRIRDDITGTEQIDCAGVFTGRSGGRDVRYYYQITVPVAEIAETAQIYNRLLLIVGLATMCIGALAMFLVSDRLTKPVKELTDLSQRMSQLDFSARYTGTASDEIGRLGENMNEMAARLEENIERLQTANAQLMKDLEEKDKIGRQRKELLANISHELKTPIAIIQGYSEGLRDGISEDPETRARYCGIILDETEKMDRMVRQLLSLDALESGNAAVNRELFELPELLRGEGEAFALQGEEKQVKPAYELPESLPVFTDQYLLEQVVQNYLSNAYHYVNEGGTVRVSACRLGRTGYRISVYNSGDPIPEASLSEIWDKFYKVDKARSRAYGGSGIGLSVVKAAAEALGGSCGVRNLEGGVEFWAEEPGQS